MYRLIALLLVLIPSSLVHATAITDLPGFVTIFGCIYMGNGQTACLGPTGEEIRAGQVFFDHMQDAIPFRAGFSDRNGVIGQSKEFFWFFLPNGGNLDFAEILFDAFQPVRFEYANTITATDVTFAPGFGPDNLSQALGPPDGSYVQLLRGPVVFGFALSAPVITVPTPEPAPESPTPVPEPTTLTLLAVGSVVLKLATQKRRAGRRQATV
jgi:hypothetical protein